MDLVTAHEDIINATHSGFAFLIANGIGWVIAGILAIRWPITKTAMLLLLMGFFTTPLAFALREVLGFPDYNPGNPLNPLAILIAFTPVVAIPAVLVTYLKYPLYLPMVMAALLGGHFLPYSWLYQTNAYLVMGIAVAIVPSTLMLVLRERGFAMGPLFVGIVLIAGAFIVY